MRLLSLDYFAQIFEPYSQQTVGLVDGVGNVGDLLLQQATRQLLVEFDVKWRTLNPFADMPQDYGIKTVLLFAGGSMGGFRPCRIIRQQALLWNVQCVVLPQSFLSPEEGEFAKVFVRETESLKHSPNGILVPDLALGYDFPQVGSPTQGTGLFLREKGLSIFPDAVKTDPAGFCDTPQEYVNFAAQFAHIITDRLHLAISALGVGRQVTLLPVGYHKNRSMWETWLKQLGCRWSRSIEDVYVPPSTCDDL